MFFIFFINLILNFANANQFTKFLTYNNLGIASQSQPILKLKDSFQVSQQSPDKSCMLACSLNSDCVVAMIEENMCTLFNNQTVLLYTDFSNSSKLFSRNKMIMCPDEYYVNMSSIQYCQAKKLNGTSCLSMEECLSSSGLECSDGGCQCLLQDYKSYTFFNSDLVLFFE